jgi:hypothetical protein
MVFVPVWLSSHGLRPSKRVDPNTKIPTKLNEDEQKKVRTRKRKRPGKGTRRFSKTCTFYAAFRQVG